MIDFGTALLHLKAGRAVARAAQSQRGAAVVLVPPMTVKVSSDPLTKMFGAGAEVPMMTTFALAVGGVLLPWAPTCSDILASDWSVVDILPP